MGKHGNGIGSGYSTLSYHLLDDDQVVFECPFGLYGAGENGYYTINADVGNTTGAVIIAFKPYSVPDRAIWTYDGQSASEYSSPIYGYLQDVIGRIGYPTKNCANDFSNNNGSNGVAFTSANNYYYDADSQQFEIVDQTPVSLNGGNAYSAAQVNLTASDPGFVLMVVPKPNLTPSALNVVVEGPCEYTGWDINIECPRPLQARPASQVNCNGIKMDDDVEIEASKVQLDLSLGTTNLGISVGTYVFGEFIPDGTTVASIQSTNEITLSAPATQSGGGNKITFSDSIAYFADVSQLDGNTVGSDNQSDFNVEVHDWVYADSSAVNSISGTWYISKNQYTQLDLVKMNYANDVVTSFEVCDPPCTIGPTCTTSHVVVGNKIRFTVMCGGNNVTTSIGSVGILDLPGSGYVSQGPYSGTYIELDLPPDGEYTLVISDAAYGCQSSIVYNFVLGTGGCNISWAGNYNSNATFNDGTCTCPTWTSAVVVNSDASDNSGTGSYFTVTWNMPNNWVNGFNYIIYNAATNTPIAASSIPSGSSDITSKTFTNFEPGDYFIQTQILGLGDEENCVSNNTSFTIDLVPVVSGCTDPNDANYNPNATVDDGSCSCYGLGVNITSKTNTTGGNCNGVVAAVGTGGSGNYNVEVIDANGVPQNPFALCAGTYTVRITDHDNGCIATQSVTIT